MRRAAILLLAGMAAACQPRPAPPAAPSGLRAASVEVRVPARSDTARVLLYVPPERPAGELLPALLYLHGGSQRGDDLEKLRAYGPPRLLAEGWEPPFVVIAPQLLEGEIWTDADLLIALVDELGERLPLDPDRLYVAGMSMGGRGAWYLAYRYPERVAAIAPVAAFQPIAHWASSGRLRSVPVLAFHGDRDELAPLSEAAAMHEALLAAGGRSELRVLPARDHFIADVLSDPELYRWLLAQRR